MGEDPSSDLFIWSSQNSRLEDFVSFKYCAGTPTTPSTVTFHIQVASFVPGCFDLLVMEDAVVNLAPLGQMEIYQSPFTLVGSAYIDVCYS